MKDLSHHKETFSFDADMTDSDGRKISVDCKVVLPTIWGDKADIEVAVPHSVMPIRGFENPCELNLVCSDPVFRVKLSDLWYRNLPTSVYPSRLHGAAPIKLTHISSMRVVREFSQSTSLFNIYNAIGRQPGLTGQKVYYRERGFCLRPHRQVAS